MLKLILFLVASSFLVYAFQSNSMLVTVNVGPYIFSDIPLFFVILGSFMGGLVLFYLMSIAPAISAWMKLRGKVKEIKEKRDEVLELTKRVHKLELENEKLLRKSTTKTEDRNAL